MTTGARSKRVRSKRVAFRRRFGLELFEAGFQMRAEFCARLALKHDEAPGEELAVIGRARADRKKRVQLLLRWGPDRSCFSPASSGATPAAAGFPAVCGRRGPLSPVCGKAGGENSAMGASFTGLGDDQVFDGMVKRPI
jgi:hypothetical protein